MVNRAFGETDPDHRRRARAAVRDPRGSGTPLRLRRDRRRRAGLDHVDARGALAALRARDRSRADPRHPCARRTSRACRVRGVSDTTTVAASRGVLGAGYTVLTPQPLREPLPNLRDGLLTSLSRRAGPQPARFASTSSGSSPAAALTPVAPGFEDFLYVLAGEVAVRAEWSRPHAAARRLGLPAARGRLRPARGRGCGRGAVAQAPLRAVAGSRRPRGARGHRDDEPFSPIRRARLPARELFDPLDPRHDFNMSPARLRRRRGAAQGRVHDEEHGLS